MSLFKKEEKTDLNRKDIIAPQEKRSMKNEKDPIASVLAKEMVITGEITFKGKARFDGTVQGDINGEYLILSDTAQVTGNIDVTTLVCHGKVEGNVMAEVVTAHATSEIHGILKSENLTVESGASLDGEIHASSRKQGTDAPSRKKTDDKSEESIAEKKK